MRSAATNLKKVQLECGGKSASIVFDDVDVDSLVSDPGFLLSCALIHSGQVCFVGSRLLVQESIHDNLVEKLVAAFKSWSVGKPDDPDLIAKMPFIYSALTNSEQLSRVTQHVADAQEDGATLLCGGERLNENGLNSGLFFAPTIFDNVSPTSRLAQNEVFGPVLAITTFETEEEAIEIANLSDYGLRGYVWTSNLQRALKMARGIKTGAVSINEALPPSSWQPFGTVRSYKLLFVTHTFTNVLLVA